MIGRFLSFSDNILIERCIAPGLRGLPGVLSCALPRRGVDKTGFQRFCRLADRSVCPTAGLGLGERHGSAVVAVPLVDGPRRVEYLAWNQFNPSPATRALLEAITHDQADVATDSSGISTL